MKKAVNKKRKSFILIIFKFNIIINVILIKTREINNFFSEIKNFNTFLIIQ
jgi:hypothetical protein